MKIGTVILVQGRTQGRFKHARSGGMKHFLPLALLSAALPGFDAAAQTPVQGPIQNPGPPQATPQAAVTTAQLRARCSQLIHYYDRYGVGRSLHSDGRRNMSRMDAEIDCSRGQFAQGIATMEKLLVAKKFTLPPAGLPDEPDIDE